MEFAKGGIVEGDLFLGALLERGGCSYMVPARALEHHRPLLEAINNGTHEPPGEPE